MVVLWCNFVRSYIIYAPVHHRQRRNRKGHINRHTSKGLIPRSKYDGDLGFHSFELTSTNLLQRSFVEPGVMASSSLTLSKPQILAQEDGGQDALIYKWSNPGAGGGALSVEDLSRGECNAAQRAKTM